MQAIIDKQLLDNLLEEHRFLAKLYEKGLADWDKFKELEEELNDKHAKPI